MRKKIVAGNWKMNVTPSAARKMVAQMQPVLDNPDVDVILCVPAIDIIPVVQEVEGSSVKVGAENMYYEESGAYTGELSAEMLVDAGVEYVIVGHSERRMYFGEDNRMINRKIRKALEHGITPIICCGETVAQRKAGETLEWIREQIACAFERVEAAQVRTCIIAYEPIWAIGTGCVATTEQAQEVCAAIRSFVADLYDEETAEELRILYGGSVNMKNAAELFAEPDIDGGLVGGASIKPEFGQIVNYNRECIYV